MALVLPFPEMPHSPKLMETLTPWLEGTLENSWLMLLFLKWKDGESERLSNFWIPRMQLVVKLGYYSSLHRLGSSPNNLWVKDLGTKSLFERWPQEAIWEDRNVRQVNQWTSGAHSCWETSEKLWEWRGTSARILEWLSIISHLLLVVALASVTPFPARPQTGWDSSAASKCPQRGATGIYRTCPHATTSEGPGEDGGYRAYQSNA